MRPSFQRDQIIVVVVEEIQKDGGLLCNLQGSLLRIENKTGRQYKAGDRVKLQVLETDPVKLILFERNMTFQRLV